METQYALLGLLSREANYGYELKKLYNQYFAADKPILAGQIYATLSRLLRDAKVAEVVDDTPSGGPARTRYALTQAGSATVLNWLNTPQPPSPTLQADLYFKVVLALIMDGDASAFLSAQRKTHLARMRELTKRKLHASLAEKLLIDNAIFHIEADLRWIEVAGSRMSKLKEELCLN